MLTKARLLLWVTVLSGGGIASPLPALSDVILKESVTYYEVRGKSGRELFKSMVKNGPRVGRSGRDHALATTEYNYDIKNVDVEVRNGRCVPVDLDIVLSVKYTYPRWRARSGAKATTKQAWNRFNKTVIWHEKQHVRIAKELAQDYRKLLMKSRGRVSDQCNPSLLGSKWRIGMANLKHNRKQRQFDRRDLRPGGRGYEAQLNLLKAE